MVQDLSQDPLLTVAEVARYLRVDETTVRRWVASGALEAVFLPRIGRNRKYRIRQSTLDALMNEK